MLLRQSHAEVCSTYPGRAEDLIVRPTARPWPIGTCATSPRRRRHGRDGCGSRVPASSRAFLACIRPSPSPVSNRPRSLQRPRPAVTTSAHRPAGPSWEPSPSRANRRRSHRPCHPRAISSGHQRYVADSHGHFEEAVAWRTSLTWGGEEAETAWHARGQPAVELASWSAIDAPAALVSTVGATGISWLAAWFGRRRPAARPRARPGRPRPASGRRTPRRSWRRRTCGG